MSLEFVAGAIRDLVLLLVGGFLTLLGSAVAAWNARRQERRIRGRESVGVVRSHLLELYLEARQQLGAGELSRLRLDPTAMHMAERDAGLIPDRQVRESVGGALKIVRGLGPAIELGYIDDVAPNAQMKTLFAALQVLEASLREDKLPVDHLVYIDTLASATDIAWKELIEKQEAYEAG